jgi:hypothetical protein
MSCLRTALYAKLYYQLAFRGFILCSMKYMEGHVRRGRRGKQLLDDLEDTQNT